MSDHPPIPPGCEQWERFFTELFCDSGRRYKRDAAEGETATRRVQLLRAAFYRTRWQDEARRLRESEAYVKRHDATTLAVRAAEADAEAWRKWGTKTRGSGR